MESELFRDLVEVGSTDKGDGTFFPQVPQQLKHLLGGSLYDFRGIVSGVVTLWNLDERT